MSHEKAVAAVIDRQSLSPELLEKMYLAGAVVIGVALAINCLKLAETLITILVDPAAAGGVLWIGGEVVALSLVVGVLLYFRDRILKASKEL